MNGYHCLISILVLLFHQRNLQVKHCSSSETKESKYRCCLGENVTYIYTASQFRLSVVVCVGMNHLASSYYQSFSVLMNGNGRCQWQPELITIITCPEPVFSVSEMGLFPLSL